MDEIQPYDITKDALAYAVFKAWEVKNPTLIGNAHVNISVYVRCFRPICGVEQSKRGKTICGLIPNHDYLHQASIYREDDGSLRDSKTNVWFKRFVQPILFYDNCIKYPNSNTYLPLMINPYCVDPIAFRQNIFNEYFSKLSYNPLNTPFKCRDDFKHFQLDYDTMSFHFLGMSNSTLAPFRAIMTNPQLPHPTFFSKEYLTTHPVVKEKIAYLLKDIDD